MFTGTDFLFVESRNIVSLSKLNQKEFVVREFVIIKSDCNIFRSQQDSPPRWSYSFYESETSWSSKADKESNKEASFQYLERAKKCWQCGNNEEAQRFAEKAMKLYPSEEAKELISKISESQKTEKENLNSMERILKSNDYYEILGIVKWAGKMDIFLSYFKLVQQYTGQNKSLKAAEAFQKIQKAYEVLSDEKKRKHYDQANSLPPKPSPSSPTRTHYGSTSWNYTADSNPQESFNENSNSGGQSRTRMTNVDLRVQTGNPSQLKTITMRLKLIAVALNILFLICILCGEAGTWDIFVSGFGIAATLLFCLVLSLFIKALNLWQEYKGSFSSTTVINK